tara:strand:- start:1489 stop:1659 length:171 start_codon:yes stop_codon:yes gene_type:complete
MFLVILAWVVLIPLLGIAAFSVFKSKMMMFERMMGRYNAVPPFDIDDFTIKDDETI